MNTIANTDFHLDDFNPDNDVFLGPEESNVTLIVYGDYSCQHCKTARDILRRIVDRIDQQVTFVYRQNPSDNRLPYSELASKAALAADSQNRFWELHAAMFEEQRPMTNSVIDELATNLGLDMAQFNEDLAGTTIAQKLAANKASAEQAQVALTPTLFINGRLYQDPWDELSLIEAIERPLGAKVKFAMRDFFSWAASSGLVLILATIAALLLVNLGFQAQYEHLIHLPFGLNLGETRFELSLHTWINDGLMAIFFLLVGIEIKREVLDGELASWSSAMLPLFGAIGGMVFPALLYLSVNAGLPGAHGWGIPMATDIAFTLGILALLGRRVPVSLLIFVSALAIADDLGAIIVIALFYGHGFDGSAFVVALCVIALMAVMNRSKVYARLPYYVLGVVLWAFVYQSGLHATLAGVLTALLIPSRRSANSKGVAMQFTSIFEAEQRKGANQDTEQLSDTSVEMLSTAVERLKEPSYHIEQSLGNWSNYLILPVFAFVNTGLLIVGTELSLLSPESLGVFLGLVVGKPLGILLSCWIALKFGFASLSAEITWRHLAGASCLAGVGFTMSIFIAGAAFSGELLASIKLSILIASLVSALLGVALLLWRSNESA